VNAGGDTSSIKSGLKIITKTVPALRGDYKKGYDRLTNGLCLRESVGYLISATIALLIFIWQQMLCRDLLRAEELTI